MNHMFIFLNRQIGLLRKGELKDTGLWSVPGEAACLGGVCHYGRVWYVSAHDENFVSLRAYNMALVNYFYFLFIFRYIMFALCINYVFLNVSVMRQRILAAVPAVEAADWPSNRTITKVIMKVGARLYCRVPVHAETFRRATWACVEELEGKRRNRSGARRIPLTLTMRDHKTAGSTGYAEVPIEEVEVSSGCLSVTLFKVT